MKEIIQQISGSLPKDKKAYELATILINDQGSLEEPEIQENLNDLLYFLYVLEMKEDILKFEQYFISYEITSNKFIWTWIESSLCVLARVNKELKREVECSNCVEKIKEAFNLGSEMAVQVNARARQRRLDGVDLMYDKIEESISAKNSELEFDYRLVKLKKLFFISVLGYSEIMNESKVEDEIKINLEFLRKHPFSGVGVRRV